MSDKVLGETSDGKRLLNKGTEIGPSAKVVMEMEAEIDRLRKENEELRRGFGDCDGGDPCPGCENCKPCPYCGGTGSLGSVYGIAEAHFPCEHCDGTGKKE